MPRRPNAYSQLIQETQKQEPEQETEKQPTVQTAKHLDVQESQQVNTEPESQSDRQTTKQETSKTAKQQRIKATFYLHPEDIIAIDEMQTKRFRQNGKKPEKSELVSEAIQLLSKQLNS